MQAVATKRIQTRDLQELLRQQSGPAAARNPLASISPDEVPADKDGTSIIRLDVFQVHAFKGNPRTATNEKCEEIRESIRAVGLQQKIHVCKHPIDGYITARGGCTRLSQLHALASERDAQDNPTEDARRFQKVDFILVPYTKDSDLSVCHLSENLQRSDMSFWDTATGVFSTCGQLEKELDREIGVRDLEDLLKARGLSVNYTALIDYAFALDNLSQLPGDLRHRVTRTDIRQLLRPGQRLLGEFWQQHGGKGQEEFLQAYRSSVALVQEDNFTMERLHANIRDYIGMKLGYEAEQFQGLLDSFKIDKQAPLTDLLNPPAQEPGEDAHGDPGDQEPDTPDGGDPDASSGQSTDPLGGDDQSPSGASTGENLTGLTRTGVAGHPGLQVASGLTSKKDMQQAAQASVAGPSPQAEFANMHPAEVAGAHLQAQLQDLCVLVGVQDYLRQSVEMPTGFYMDLPEPGHLGGIEDLAVQGWWLLASLSGQLSHGMARLPEGSAMRLAMTDDAAWHGAIESRLGGVALNSSDFLGGLLTSPTHMLADPALALVQAIRALFVARESEGIEP